MNAWGTGICRFSDSSIRTLELSIVISNRYQEIMYLKMFDY